jgi:signal transduction histidine kinase
MSRALIVDDKPENLYFLTAMLSGNGYSVDRAANGVEALAVARSQPPDLIISDILMPGMDGFALCRQWRADPKLRDIPFVFYTATYTDPKDEQLAMKIGADLFLVKPQEPEAFMEQIRRVLERQQVGQLRQSLPAELEEASYLRQYNATLVHKLEDKLVELERANKVKDALLGSVSHELRTPLTPVMLLLDLMACDPGTPQHVREDLATIRRHIEIEKRLIGDLLDYAAMQAGSLYLNRGRLSLHEIARQAVGLWRGQIQAQALRLDLRLESPSDQVMGDSERLMQLLWNLMHNAIRRSPSNATITVRSWQPRPDGIALEVSDAGKALDAQTIEWAFSPFAGVNRIGGASAPDVGLGLAVSKGIVEGHGGSISIQRTDKPPRTSVTVQLPLHQPE